MKLLASWYLKMASWPRTQNHHESWPLGRIEDERKWAFMAEIFGKGRWEISPCPLDFSMKLWKLAWSRVTQEVKLDKNNKLHHGTRPLGQKLHERKGELSYLQVAIWKLEAQEGRKWKRMEDLKLLGRSLFAPKLHGFGFSKLKRIFMKWKNEVSGVCVWREAEF